MNSQYPTSFEELIGALKSFPGVGRRGAERMAFSILKWSPEKLENFADLLHGLPERITNCPECGNLAEEGRICEICIAPSRDRSVICVVEDPSQIHNIEKSALYKGLYHVLGGKLSPLSGVEVSDLNLDSLSSRLDNHDVKELIIALSPDVEGQATAVYISELYSGKNLKITRPAQGLPAGSDISYADAATIAAALNGRTGI